MALKVYFKNYVSWGKLIINFPGKLIDPHYSGLNSLQEVIEKTMPYHVMTTQSYDLRDVAEHTTGDWTAYTHPFVDQFHYFFKHEQDAVYFKLVFS